MSTVFKPDVAPTQLGFVRPHALAVRSRITSRRTLSTRFCKPILALARTEHVLDLDADFVLLSVSFDLCVRQRVVPGSAAMDSAFEAALIELRFGLSRAVGAVSVHIPRRVGGVQQPI
jgi:hypothetical protein